MIAGTITGHEPVINVMVHGVSGRRINVSFVLDTGFTGFLILPPDIVESLGVDVISPVSLHTPGRRRTHGTLHRVKVDWDGELRDMEVICMESDALLGMSALEDYEVVLEVAEGGLVSISPIS